MKGILALVLSTALLLLVQLASVTTSASASDTSQQGAVCVNLSASFSKRLTEWCRTK